MAYDAVAQSDHNAADEPTSDSSLPTEDPRQAFLRLSLDLGDLGGSFMDAAKSDGHPTVTRLSSLIRRGTSPSYEMVKADEEDEDEEEADKEDVVGNDDATPSSAAGSRLPPPNTPRIDTTSAANLIAELSRHADGCAPELPLRSPSSDEPVPLTHPTPDLQSLQGAYVGNIERLEKSAERLSLSSADLGSEIRKMDREQKRRSGSFVSTSFAARSETGGSISAIANAPSPGGSILSASRTRWTSGSQLARVTEPDHHNEDVENEGTEMGNSLQGDVGEGERQSQVMQAGGESEFHSERPATASSDDTFQQARNLFIDFDGVHFIPSDRAENAGRRVPHRRPTLASAKPYQDSREGENMVYYPAPVPMMLNLPPRLSQKPITDHGRRRTQLLGALPADNRKSSTAWLAGRDHNASADDSKRGQRLSTVPPQLRASVFFDHSPIPLDIEVKDSSAVATLDSILDASALAPVTAFTDHPYAGHAGAQVYGKSKFKSTLRKVAEQRKRRKSLNTMGVCHSSSSAALSKHSSASLGNLTNRPDAEIVDVSEEFATQESHQHDGRHTPADQHDDDELEHSSQHHDGHSVKSDEDAGHKGESERDEAEETEEDEDLDDDEDEPVYLGPPTTLLAELELRKKELQQRRRTAAVGTGLHSTLLELDAVAQKQSEQRRQRPVTLAWEDPLPNHEDNDDEDVPLAMLYPTKNDETRPLGLLERKEIEENEPLSKRRARLRGEPLAPVRQPSTLYSMQIPGLQDGGSENGEEDDEDESETLAERLKRLKAKERASTVTGSDLASEIMEALNQFTQLEEPGPGTEKRDDNKPTTEPQVHVKNDAEPDEEETLAQRRSRLQREASNTQQSRPQSQPAQYGHGQLLATAVPRLAKARRSMADILHAHPVPNTQHHTSHIPAPADHHQHQRISTFELPTNLPYATGYPNTSLPYGNGNIATAAYRMPPQPLQPPQVGYGYGSGYGSVPGYAYGHGFGSKMGMMGVHVPIGSPMAMTMANPAIDPGQREVIDRWRQSIRQ